MTTFLAPRRVSCLQRLHAPPCYAPPIRETSSESIGSRTFQSFGLRKFISLLVRRVAHVIYELFDRLLSSSPWFMPPTMGRGQKKKKKRRVAKTVALRWLCTCNRKRASCFGSISSLSSSSLDGYDKGFVLFNFRGANYPSAKNPQTVASVKTRCFARITLAFKINYGSKVW